jgi:hypothetical protein
VDYKKIEALIGKELAGEEVRAFLDETGIKYPQKDTIGASAGDWSFWLTGRKAGVELLFGIDVLNRKYKVKQAERKGVFRPVLTAVLFREKTQFTLPYQITHRSNLDELKAKLGEPVLHTFLPFFVWNVMLDSGRDIKLYVEWHIEREEVRDIWVMIAAFKEIFRFYYTQYGQTMESVLKSSYVYDEQEIKNSKRVSVIYNKAAAASALRKELFFIMWAADNGYLYLGEELKSGVEDLRTRKIDVLKFAAKAFKDDPFITLDNFVNIDQEFVYSYYHNLPSRYWYYDKDFEQAFSKETEELKIAGEISRLAYSEENRRLVSEIINKRYAEFTREEKGKSNNGKEVK